MKLRGTNEQVQIASIIDEVIRNHDFAIKVNYQPIMSVKNALRYDEQGVFKYGLSITKNHVSFHSMIMYAHSDIATFSKKQLPKAHFNKGCINFRSASEFDADAFKKIMTESSRADFSPILEKYISR